MVKRKAKELNDGAVLDELRRSSRRISTTAEKATVEKTKTTKKGRKAPATAKGDSKEVNGKSKEAPDAVSQPPIDLSSRSRGDSFSKIGHVALITHYTRRFHIL
jgi:hypothetical protein